MVEKIGKACLALLVVCVACDYQPDYEGGPARALDRACAAGGCALTGSAQQVEGVVAGAIALQSGPGAGVMSIPLEDVPVSGPWTVDVFVAGGGSFWVDQCDESPCANSEAGIVEPIGFQANDDYRWVTVRSGHDGQGTRPKKVTLRTQGGAVVTVGDVRVLVQNGGHGC
jgi:hypothetical protein